MSQPTRNGSVSDRAIVEMATAMREEGASDKEIGEILGLPATTVGIKMGNARYYKNRVFKKHKSRSAFTNGSVSDLNEVIRSVMVDEDLADPHSIAAHVLDRIAPKDREYALQICLPTQVQRVIRGMRQTARKTGRPDPTANMRQDPTVAELDRMDHHWMFDVDALGLRDHLRDRVKAGGEWKLLRDCTCEDLRVIAEDYRARAEGQIGRAEFYEGIAGALEQVGGGELTVGEAAVGS